VSQVLTARPGCWISADFPVQRMALDYAWMFVAALFNIVAYVPLYLVLKGYVAFDGWRVYRPSKVVDKMTLRHSNRVALKMLMCVGLHFCLSKYSTLA
jgi:hypothetical protein